MLVMCLASCERNRIDEGDEALTRFLYPDSTANIVDVSISVDDTWDEPIDYVF